MRLERHGRITVEEGKCGGRPAFAVIAFVCRLFLNCSEPGRPSERFLPITLSWNVETLSPPSITPRINPTVSCIE